MEEEKRGLQCELHWPVSTKNNITRREEARWARTFTNTKSKSGTQTIQTQVTQAFLLSMSVTYLQFFTLRVQCRLVEGCGERLLLGRRGSLRMGFCCLLLRVLLAFSEATRFFWFSNKILFWLCEPHRVDDGVCAKHMLGSRGVLLLASALVLPARRFRCIPYHVFVYLVWSTCRNDGLCSMCV